MPEPGAAVTIITVAIFPSAEIQALGKEEVREKVKREIVTWASEYGETGDPFVSMMYWPETIQPEPQSPSPQTGEVVEDLGF